MLWHDITRHQQRHPQALQHSSTSGKQLMLLHRPAVSSPTAHVRRQSNPHRGSTCCKAAEHSKGPLQSHSADVTGSSSSTGRFLQTDGAQLAQLLLRLSLLHVKPHQQWLTDALDTLQPQLTHLNPQELSGCLQAMGTWGVTPADSFMQQYRAAVQRLLQQRKLSMRQLGEIAWGLAQLQDTDTAAIMTDVLEGAELLLAAPLHVSSSSGTASHAGMADLIWAVAKLQHHPGHAFLASFEAASQRLLETFTPHELAQIVWAFARLAWQPDEPWKELFLQAVQERLKLFDSKSISLTAWSLATLKFAPGSRWLFNFERQAECVLSTLAAAELACTLWALSELKKKHPHQLRLGRLVRRQEVFHPFDFQLLINPRLLRVVRSLTLGPSS